MYSADTKIRVSYGDTDKMGYCYYGNYPRYYEIARTELLRGLGMSYNQLEKEGTMMPVISMNINYLKPVYYDELITVRAIIKEIPRSRIRFDYEIFNEKDELVNTGETVLAFINAEKMRPQAAPEELTSLFEKM